MSPFLFCGIYIYEFTRTNIKNPINDGIKWNIKSIFHYLVRTNKRVFYPRVRRITWKWYEVQQRWVLPSTKLWFNVFIIPHTFKIIAEHSKGSEVDDEQEIKDILLDKEISDLMNDWDDFRKVLLNDRQSQREGFNLFNKGKMEEWDDNKIDNTYYMGRFSKVFPDALKDTTSSGLIKQMTGDDGNIKPHHKGYVSNIENLRNERHRELPSPFVMKLPSGGREGNEYTLIGGHKRSTIANQLNVPISVWFIDLSEWIYKRT